MACRARGANASDFLELMPTLDVLLHHFQAARVARQIVSEGLAILTANGAKDHCNE